MLDHSEKKAATEDIALIIRSFGTTGDLIRPVVAEAGSFAGPHEFTEETITTAFPLEWRQLSPEDLKQIGTDGIIHVLPYLDIQEGDFVVFKDKRYRVTDIEDENLFGTVTHSVIKLEQENRA